MTRRFDSAAIAVVKDIELMTLNKRLVVILVAIAGILLVPLVAMGFTDEIAWSLIDFVVAAALLVLAGLTFEFFARRGGSTKSRVIAAVAIATVLLVVWLELAIGIFGSPLAGS